MRPNDKGNRLNGFVRFLRLLLVLVLAVQMCPGVEGFVLAATDNNALVDAAPSSGSQMQEGDASSSGYAANTGERKRSSDESVSNGVRSFAPIEQSEEAATEGGATDDVLSDDVATKDFGRYDAMEEDANDDAAGEENLSSLELTTSVRSSFANAVPGPLRAAGDSSSLPNIVYTGINNPANTTIDLFDYWITGQRDDDHDSSAPAASGYYGGTVYNRGINKDHLLLFHGGAGGQHPGQNAADDFTGMYSGDPDQAYKSPSLYWGPVIQGIVKNTLENGYPVLSNNGEKSYNAIDASEGGPKDPRNQNLFMASSGSPYTLSDISSGGAPKNESLAYLFDPSMTGVAGRASYHDVNGLFSVDSEGFYLYDSGRQAAHYKESSKRFELTNHESGKNGFWPLDDYRTPEQLAAGKHNDYSGMHMNMSFSIPANGEVLNPQGQYVPMTFTFAGDDDVWVFIDDVLVGDVGGIHQPSSLQIDFKTGTVNVNRNFNGITCPAQGDRGADPNSAEYVAETNLKTIFTNAGKAGADSNWNGNRFADGTYHKIDFFYLERGNNESNLQIRFNMVNTGDFTAHKALVANPQESLANDQFKFELIGLDGVWQRDSSSGALSIKNENTQAIMPKGATAYTNENAAAAAGDVSRFYERDDVNKRWIYRVGASADGNVNFGNADFSLVTGTDATYAVGDAFHYIVREYQSDSKEDGYERDARVYYMEARIAYDNVNKEYYLSKSYYTDDTFKTRVADTSYISFVNLKGAPGVTPQIPVTKDLKQGDSYIPITAGQFSFELLNSSHDVVSTASCGQSGSDSSKTATATLALPKLTPVDFRSEAGTIERSYKVREIIPDGATNNNNGTYTYNGIVYNQTVYDAKLSATYDSTNNNITYSFEYKNDQNIVNSIEYHNTVDPVSVDIEKSWNDDAAGSGMVLPHPAVTFRVVRDGETATDNNGILLAAPTTLESESPRAQDQTIAADTVTDDNVNTGTATWTGLPTFDASGTRLGYNVIEIEGAPGYEAGTITRVGDAGFSYKITNTLKPLKLTILKMAQRAGQQGTTPLEGAGFTITRVDPQTLEPYASDNDSYFEQTVTTNGSGEASYNSNSPLLYAGTYRIAETTVPLGYEKTEDRYITINDNGTGEISVGKQGTPTGLTSDNYDSTTRTFSISITNAQADLVIKKTDLKDSSPLAGAVFKMYKDAGVAGEQISYVKEVDYKDEQIFTDGQGVNTFTSSGNDASVRIERIRPGTYWLIETEAPDGYVVRGPDNPIRIDVSENGSVTLHSDYANDQTVSFVAKDSTHADNELTVKNVRVYLLPATAGPGKLTLIFAGAFIATLAAGIFLSSRREATALANDASATDRGR